MTTLLCKIISSQNVASESRYEDDISDNNIENESELLNNKSLSNRLSPRLTNRLAEKEDEKELKLKLKIIPDSKLNIDIRSNEPIIIKQKFASGKSKIFDEDNLIINSEEHRRNDDDRSLDAGTGTQFNNRTSDEKRIPKPEIIEIIEIKHRKDVEPIEELHEILNMSSINNNTLMDSVKESARNHNSLAKITQNELKPTLTLNNDHNVIKNILSLNNKHDNIVSKLRNLYKKAQQYGEKHSILDLEWYIFYLLINILGF